ncbi:MAG: D-cysteine desulfhydrase family protein [Pseudomonadota bacterium]
MTVMTDAASALPALNAFRRVDLGAHRTPVEPLPRLGEMLGIRLHVKRDDLFSLALGGNKVRQLEYFLGPALDCDADTVLVSGATQSNMVRLTVAAARRLGLSAVVQLEDRVPRDDATFHGSGNVLLDRLLGADIHHVPADWDEARATANLDRLADKCRAAGQTPFVIHTAPDQMPLGSLGYAIAAVEVFDQFPAAERPDHVVIASGSGISHAGFLAGARALGWDVPVHGICVRRPADAQRPRLMKRLVFLADMLGDVPVQVDAVLLNDVDFAPGYGVLNDAVLKAVRLAAETEALLLDPTYTGRTFAGLMSLVREGTIRPNARVLFMHTGGQPGLFAYADDLIGGDAPGRP